MRTLMKNKEAYPEATPELRKIAAFCKRQWGGEKISRRFIESLSEKRKYIFFHILIWLR